MALPYDTDKDATQNPSGVRIGVQELTRLGMKEKEMREVADIIKEVVLDKKNADKTKKKVINFRKKFQKIKYCF